MKINYRQAIILTLMLFVSVHLFISGAKKQSQENDNMKRGDQKGYMNYAVNMAQTKWLHIGNRNRMPVYPAIMSLFYKEGMSDEEFFAIGKKVNRGIALLVSLLAFIIFARVARLFDAAVATLVAMFTVLAYRAPYFQTEVLFYGICLILFYLSMSMIQKPDIAKAAVTGMFFGVGHLTKASVIPAMLLLAAILFLRGIIKVKSVDSPSDGNNTAGVGRIKKFFFHAGYISILFFYFLAVVFPYIQTSKERFGRYFYNVNSTFYIWYDSWEQVEKGTKEYGDRNGWPNMPPEEIPSFRKYMREHSFAQIMKRFTKGFKVIWKETTRSYGYMEYVLMYTIFLILFYAYNFKKTVYIVKQSNPFIILYVIGYFGGYLVLYAWYTAIAAGNRFVLALFLPLMFTFMLLLSKARSEELNFPIENNKILPSFVSPFVLISLAVYIISVYPYRIATMYCGR